MRDSGKDLHEGSDLLAFLRVGFHLFPYHNKVPYKGHMRQHHSDYP